MNRNIETDNTKLKSFRLPLWLAKLVESGKEGITAEAVELMSIGAKQKYGISEPVEK